LKPSSKEQVREGASSKTETQVAGERLVLSVIRTNRGAGDVEGGEVANWSGVPVRSDRFLVVFDGVRPGRKGSPTVWRGRETFGQIHQPEFSVYHKKDGQSILTKPAIHRLGGRAEWAPAMTGSLGWDFRTRQARKKGKKVRRRDRFKGLLL